jgi:hypothetical protein
VHIHSIITRALRQRATHNIDMAVEPEEGGKLAHGRLQSTLPVLAKTRMHTITSDGTPRLLCLRNPGRHQTAIFLLQKTRNILTIFYCENSQDAHSFKVNVKTFVTHCIDITAHLRIAQSPAFTAGFLTHI